mgnify:CR=1 FL=1
MADLFNIHVVQMGVESTNLLSTIHNEAFKNTSEQKWGQKTFQKLCNFVGTSVYAICLDDKPIGFAVIRKVLDEAEIITFCILPKWCKNGYATYLLEWIIDTLQTQSVKRLFLEVRENNDAAIRLYKKCSFKIIGCRKGYYQGRHGEKTDAHVMQIQLIEKLD